MYLSAVVKCVKYKPLLSRAAPVSQTVSSYAPTATVHVKVEIGSIRGGVALRRLEAGVQLLNPPCPLLWFRYVL